MSIVAAYRTSSPELVLATAVTTVPEVKLDVAHAVSTDRGRPTWFLWADGTDLDAFECAMADDPTVTDVERMREVADARLYTLQVTRAASVYADSRWSDLDASNYASRFRDGWWNSVTRFADRGTLDAYLAFLDQRDVTVELDDVFVTLASNGERPLTRCQRETVEFAYRRGFFEIPREATMSDLADEFDVSEQAISQRLRRAYARLVESEVVE
ncbi:helix-turn-helix domain-containing protein [Halomarina halobia]|uniref:Helix-turn-helix domain-containing protein n=1 Tax=Halomarina halobia TaxID=3033386 RepID=A0ABD6AAU9_9EURY|nr:helix-turn-helix domain-containing protein [Halomarina sp. PSR21]